jgi:hypothetical protein
LALAAGPTRQPRLNARSENRAGAIVRNIVWFVVRPVIFDLDGVLIDSEPYYELAFSEYLREIGMSDQGGLFALTVGRRNRSANCFAGLMRSGTWPHA